MDKRKIVKVLQRAEEIILVHHTSPEEINGAIRMVDQLGDENASHIIRHVAQEWRGHTPEPYTPKEIQHVMPKDKVYDLSDDELGFMIPKVTHLNGVSTIEPMPLAEIESILLELGYLGYKVDGKIHYLGGQNA